MPFATIKFLQTLTHLDFEENMKQWLLFEFLFSRRGNELQQVSEGHASTQTEYKARQ